MLTSLPFFSPVSASAIFVLPGGCVPRAAAGTATPYGAPGPPGARGTCASHDDGNYLLYVSVDTVIRGLITRTAPHDPVDPSRVSWRSAVFCLSSMLFVSLLSKVLLLTLAW